MNKGQLIEAIRQHNESVQPAFLQQFDEEALLEYLRHLESAAHHDLRITSWSRRQPRVRIAG